MEEVIIMAAKSSSTMGIDNNTAGALSYVLGPISGLIFLVLSRDKTVRFHAMQSTVLFVVLFAIQWVMAFTIILLPLVPLLTVLGFLLWLILIYKAWQGEVWEVPVLGVYARKWSK